ncbi:MULTISPECIES: histidine phosphatase family protein [unclassified Sinorhizobium]|uniref:SixA phosphatase family protein n=1 Tax=unclassified Sinorhizobium TaxID=2613772 RepID=UPI0035268D17
MARSSATGSSAKRRRLILLRHGKSAWPNGVADQDRPLASRGQKSAPVMGAYLAREELVPDLVLVSTARRTQETWKLVSTALPPHVAKRDLTKLYAAAATEILKIVHAIEPSAATVMLIGHNPGLQAFALDLCREEDRDARRRLQEKFPTCGLAVIDFEANRWEDITPTSGHLERFVTPRSLV